MQEYQSDSIDRSSGEVMRPTIIEAKSEAAATKAFAEWFPSQVVTGCRVFNEPATPPHS